MSRKRKYKAKAPRESAAPVEEVLAEGSGPVEAAVETSAESSETSGEVDVVVHEVEVEVIADDVAMPGVEALADDLERRMDDAECEPIELELGASAQADAGEPIDTIESAEVIDGEAIDPAATLPTSASSLDGPQLKQLVEALVFASDKPITVVRLRQLTRVSDTKRLEQSLAELAEDYRDRGLVLQTVSGGYQFRTRTQWAAWVQQLIAGRPVRLTRAQLETLAIIAYRQPITRPEIDEIRGVDSSATLKLLIDRALIRILGKKEEVGRPMLYGTTKEFLDFFSLGDLRELPTLREYSELTDESRQVMTDRLGIAPDGGDEGGGNGGSGGGGGGDGGAGPAGGFEPEPGDAGSDAGVGAAAEVVELEEMLATMRGRASDEQGEPDAFATTEPGEVRASDVIASMRSDAFADTAPGELSASDLIAAMRAEREASTTADDVPAGTFQAAEDVSELAEMTASADSIDASAGTPDDVDSQDVSAETPDDVDSANVLAGTFHAAEDVSEPLGMSARDESLDVPAGTPDDAASEDVLAGTDSSDAVPGSDAFELHAAGSFDDIRTSDVITIDGGEWPQGSGGVAMSPRPTGDGEDVEAVPDAETIGPAIVAEAAALHDHPVEPTQD